MPERKAFIVFGVCKPYRKIFRTFFSYFPIEFSEVWLQKRTANSLKMIFRRSQASLPAGATCRRAVFVWSDEHSSQTRKDFQNQIFFSIKPGNSSNRPKRSRRDNYRRLDKGWFKVWANLYELNFNFKLDNRRYRRYAYRRTNFHFPQSRPLRLEGFRAAL